MWRSNFFFFYPFLWARIGVARLDNVEFMLIFFFLCREYPRHMYFQTRSHSSLAVLLYGSVYCITC